MILYINWAWVVKFFVFLVLVILEFYFLLRDEDKLWGRWFGYDERVLDIKFVI